MPSIQIIPLIEDPNPSIEEPSGDNETEKEPNNNQTPTGNLQEIPYTKSRRQIATRARLTAVRFLFT